MKKIICVFLSYLVLASSLGNAIAFAADSNEDIRKKNLDKCIEQFLKDAPLDFKLRNIAVQGSEDLKQPAWLEDGIISNLVNKNVVIIEQNAAKNSQAAVRPDYIVSYKLVEEKKDSLSVAFKLIDGTSNRLLKYVTVKGEQPVEKIDYEHRVSPAPYVKPVGRPWGLYMIIGALLVGYALIPKI